MLVNSMWHVDYGDYPIDAGLNEEVIKLKAHQLRLLMSLRDNIEASLINLPRIVNTMLHARD